MRKDSRRCAPRFHPVRLPTWMVFIALWGLAACNWIVDPLPRGAERFAPPAVYARWWAMTEACSGRSGNLGGVDWYRMPGSQFVRGRRSVGGYWNRYSNRIVIAEVGIEDGPTVRHEMLHALLKAGGHPRSQFFGACAALVYCQESCIGDAGRWQLPQEDYAVLPPDSLEVTSRAELLPRESDGQRWVSLEVTVANPRGRAVLVATPGEWVAPRTFGFKLAGPFGGISAEEVATDSSTLFFKPYETKRRLFEFLVASDLSSHHITPGTYAIGGSYARRWGVLDMIEVSP